MYDDSSMSFVMSYSQDCLRDVLLTLKSFTLSTGYVYSSLDQVILLDDVMLDMHPDIAGRIPAQRRIHPMQDNLYRDVEVVVAPPRGICVLSSSSVSNVSNFLQASVRIFFSQVGDLVFVKFSTEKSTSGWIYELIKAFRIASNKSLEE